MELKSLLISIVFSVPAVFDIAVASEVGKARRLQGDVANVLQSGLLNEVGRKW